MIWRIENAPAGEGKSGTHSALRWGQGRSVSPRKKRSCAAIDFRPFRFLADKAAVAADFHLENDACYHGKRRIASTASVATLAKTGVVRPRFPCRIASKSGEYPHRSLPFWQAMHSGTHSCVLQNFSLADLLQNLVGKHPKPFNDF